MLLRIIILLLFLLIVPPFYIARRFKKNINTRKRRLMFFLPNIILLISTFYLSFFETYTPRNAWITGIFIILILGFAVTEMLFVLFCVVGHMLKKIPYMENIFIAVGVLFALINIYIVAYGYFEGKNRLTITHTIFFSTDLPAAFNGYKIVEFSDFHLGTYGQKSRIPHKIIDSIMAQKPDMIAFVGDLINYNTKEAIPYFDELKRLHSPDGVFSIMGNHDYQFYQKWKSPRARLQSIENLHNLQKKVGWNLLLNSSVIVRRKNDSIGILGVENDGTRPFPAYGNLYKTQKGLPKTENGKPFFKILLSHDPTHWRRKVLPETDIQLMLAGHTHATQFQIGSFSPASWIYKEWGGMYYQGSRALFVSKGLGEALLPFRFGAWPEINVITLYSSKR